MSKRIVILGAGESGAGAALLAKKQGYDVFVSDNGAIDPLYKSLLDEHSIMFEEKVHSEDMILNADEIIKSPGIPDSAKIITQAAGKNIPVISEIEFAAKHTDAKLIAITGTNGKTTTTLLTYHILKNNGLNVGLAGNVGFGFAKQVYDKSYDVYVLEISSFQLDGMFDTRLDVGVLLNITPDHLNRYDNDMSKYVSSKFRITQNMDEDCRFIYNSDDENIVNNLNQIHGKPKQVTISASGNDKAMAYFNGDSLVFSEFKSAVENLPLRGPHNYLNMMSAVEACRHLGLGYGQIFESIRSFKNAPHRLEFVAEINGARYYNDSKATNVDAVKYALQSFDQPIILVMGGTDKGNDYTLIEDLVKEGVKAIVALGLDNKKILSFFKSKVSALYNTHGIEEAVKKCHSIAKKGDVVLLSPACASFDLFRNYEDRGDQFKSRVKDLQGEKDKNVMMVL